MKPYWSSQNVIAIPGAYTIRMDVTKISRENSVAAFVLPAMKLTRVQGRQLERAIEMLLKRAGQRGVNVGGVGGGGRVPIEPMNDGRTWFYADKQGSYKLSFDGKYIYVPALTADPAMLARVRKLVSEAVHYRVPRLLRFAYNVYLGGW